MSIRFPAVCRPRRSARSSQHSELPRHPRLESLPRPRSGPLLLSGLRLRCVFSLSAATRVSLCSPRFAARADILFSFADGIRRDANDWFRSHDGIRRVRIAPLRPQWRSLSSACRSTAECHFSLSACLSPVVVSPLQRFRRFPACAVPFRRCASSDRLWRRHQQRLRGRWSLHRVRREACRVRHDDHHSVRSGSAGAFPAQGSSSLVRPSPRTTSPATRRLLTPPAPPRRSRPASASARRSPRRAASAPPPPPPLAPPPPPPPSAPPPPPPPAAAASSSSPSRTRSPAPRARAPRPSSS